jgi:hypothetical protein
MKPLQTIHRGRIAASALLFDEASLGTESACARVLSQWHGGASLRRIDSLLLLRFSSPRQVDCDRADGLPLTELDGALCAMPLDPAERKQLAPIAGQTLRCNAGVLESLRAGVPEDPSAWLDLSHVPVLELPPLGKAPEMPAVALVAAQIDRAKFAIPPLDPNVAALWTDAEAPGKGASTGPSPRVIRAVKAISRALEWVAKNLLPMFQAKPGKGSRSLSSSGTSARALPAPAKPRAPGFFEKLSARLDRWLAQAAVLTKLANLLSARQANYLRKLFEALDENDVEESLRTAMPLADPNAPPSGLPESPMLGLPSRRDELSISTAPSAGSRSSMSLGPMLYQELKARYRRLFERLDAQGKIDQAAFVLSELLRANSEAVDYLEKHGKLLLAAQLAEARNLPAGRIVRQWIRAGDAGRAVAIAKLREAFAEAVALLEKDHLKEAWSLRLLWADAAADAGDFATAIDAIAPIPEAAHLARDWLPRLFQHGGPASARWLAKQLASDPELLPGLRDRARLLLEDRAPETADERAVFALGLGSASKLSDAARECVRPAVRAVLRDQSRGKRVPEKELTRLLQLAGDRALAIDLPAPEANTQTPLQSFTIAAQDCGTLNIQDVALTPRRCVLVALGEAGARLYSPSGRELFRFDAPAQQLVISDRGDRALALAQRGSAWLVTKLDLVNGTSHEWGTLPLTTWTADYDGRLWFVSASSRLLCVVVTSESAAPLWTVECGSVSALARGSRGNRPGLHLIVSTDGNLEERWFYALPSFTLEERTELREIKGFISRVCLDEGGAVALAGFEPEQGTLFVRWMEPKAGALVPGAMALSGDALSHLHARTQWDLSLCRSRLCVQRARPEGALLSVHGSDGAVQISLQGSRSAAHRWQSIGAQRLLVIADDRGRVIAVDPSTNERVVDLRL